MKMTIPILYMHIIYNMSPKIKMEMSSFWRNFHHCLHWKLSKWQLPVQPVIKKIFKMMTFQCKCCCIFFLHINLGCNGMCYSEYMAPWIMSFDFSCSQLGHLECHLRDHFVYAPSQWETTLQCNVVFHWLGACTKWSLHQMISTL